LKFERRSIQWQTNSLPEEDNKWKTEWWIV